MHRKVRILIYNTTKKLYGLPVNCCIDKCLEPGNHSIIQFDSEIILCDKHLKRWYDEAEEICDKIQEMRLK